jgi:hypothetical protein
MTVRGFMRRTGITPRHRGGRSPFLRRWRARAGPGLPPDSRRSNWQPAPRGGYCGSSGLRSGTARPTAHPAACRTSRGCPPGAAASATAGGLVLALPRPRAQPAVTRRARCGPGAARRY